MLCIDIYSGKKFQPHSTKFGPSDRDRTCGLMVPNHPRSQLRHTRISIRFSSFCVEMGQTKEETVLAHHSMFRIVLQNLGKVKKTLSLHVKKRLIEW